jgi:phenylacetate-coenzyme A ligase PaaK-like adenylate-forming protein
MQGIVDKLLSSKPYEKDTKLFLGALKEELKFHYKNCIEYKKFCDKKEFDPFKEYDLESIPYLPVSIFKKFELLSVSKDEIIRTIHSSSTTGNLPSIISLDKITVNRQIIALNSIIKDFLTEKKKSFVVLDDENTVKTNQLNLSSRGSAIRGMLLFAKGFDFVLDKNLELVKEKLQKAKNNCDLDNSCIFGFTWLIYQVIQNNKNNKEITKILSDIKQPKVLHIGGWKKLNNVNINKKQFDAQVSDFFNTSEENIIDVYGMTEQLGIVYPDCSAGNKHVPIFAEILIRDINDQRILPNGKSGFIQILSPVPHSYPGISILTDDIGEIRGVDDCLCGRKGKYFIFKKRSEVAEPKGCGDTLEI